MHSSLANIARCASIRAPVAASVIGTALALSSGLSAAQDNAGGAQSAFDPECLTITQSSQTTYTIQNAACSDQSVLASIELPGNGDLARCFTKKIRSQISIASEGTAPVINYQCIEGTAGCSVEDIRSMFPECHAG
jgi:hypothetical protein